MTASFKANRVTFDGGVTWYAIGETTIAVESLPQTFVSFDVATRPKDPYAHHRRKMERLGVEPMTRAEDITAHHRDLDVRADGRHLSVQVELQYPHDWEGDPL